jgi:hypothetical protein
MITGHKTYIIGEPRGGGEAEEEKQFLLVTGLSKASKINKTPSRAHRADIFLTERRVFFLLFRPSTRS